VSRPRFAMGLGGFVVAAASVVVLQAAAGAVTEVR
jgi:hypothetical protein